MKNSSYILHTGKNVFELWIKMYDVWRCMKKNSNTAKKNSSMVWKIFFIHLHTFIHYFNNNLSLNMFFSFYNEWKMYEDFFIHSWHMLLCFFSQLKRDGKWTDFLTNRLTNRLYEEFFIHSSYRKKCIGIMN